MTRIYIDDGVILFTPQATQTTEDQRWDTTTAERPTLAKLAQKLQFNKQIEVISPRWQELFNDFCAAARLIRAAGGVVVEPAGSVMMILRNQRWDLPKGKCEPGESIETCALREVAEECGLSGLTLHGYIADTWHGYRIRRKWVLKKTAWFHMKCPAGQRPVPQTEENIARAEWVAPENLSSRLVSSYGTIRDVLEKAGYNLRGQRAFP